MNGMTWLDWALLVLLVVHTVRGLLRGTLAQVFAFLGLIVGALVLLVAGQWVGQHWAGARPAFVFTALRWLVAVLAGLAISALFDWWGEKIGKAVHDGAFGWIDRLLGGVIGAATGLGFAALVSLLLLQGPVLASTGRIAVRSVAAGPLVRAGAFASGLAAGRVPGATWLHEQFRHAVERLDERPAARVANGR